jgi:hypothetical protein
MLLNILHSGGAFWGVTAVFIVLEVIFIYQLVKGSRSGTYINDGGGGSIPSNKNKLWWTNTFFKLACAVLVLYVVALLVIRSDYRGV